MLLRTERLTKDYNGFRALDGLDLSVGPGEIFGLLGQLRRVRDQGKAVVFSSHVLSEVERVCDRVGILQRGKLVHVQKLAELRQGRVVHVRLRQAVSALPDGCRLSAIGPRLPAES